MAKVDVFGSAKGKPSGGGSSSKSDMETVVVKGMEEKLLEFDALKAQLSDIEAELKALQNEISELSKEKFVELYLEKKSNPKSFLIKDGDGCVMVIPSDKYISIKEESRADELIQKYGEEVVTVTEKYEFNTEVLERNMAVIKKLLDNAKGISDEDKRNLIDFKKTYSIAKGTINQLAQFGKKLPSVLDDIQPVIVLKNCGGRMEDGGEVAEDVIGLVYTKR